MPLKLAIIGCGAIAEIGHLPGAALCRDVEVSLLVERNRERGAKLAAEFSVPHVTENIEDVPRYADAAIIALPHHLHCPVAVDLLSKGIHVLVEKPVARSIHECDQMIAAAEAGNSVLAVAMVRRLFWGDLFLKQIIERQLLGRVLRFTIEDGGAFSWPSSTSFLLSKEQSGGGVLIGTGAHVIDSVVWWFGDPDAWTCYSDAVNDGIETDCRVEFKYNGGITGIVELSRTRSLANSAVVQCEHGTVTLPRFCNTVSINTSTPGGLNFRGDVVPDGLAGEQTLASVMADQLTKLAQAVKSDRSAVVSGTEAKRSMRIIEDCYKSYLPLEMPWINTICR